VQHLAVSLLHCRSICRRAAVVGVSILGAGLVLAAPGCRPASPPPALATGERPVTGVERYDRFFTDVSSALARVDEARDEESDARRVLARRVGLPEATAIDVVGARLRERTARWSSEGLMLELELSGISDAELADASAPDEAAEEQAASAAPSATLRTPGREPQPRELRLLEAIAQAALSGVTVYANMSHERRRVERLEPELGELRGQLASSFAVASERDRVGAKLDEAASLLTELKARCRQVGGSADVLLSVLEEAANTLPVTARRRSAAPALAPAGKPAAPEVRPLAAPAGPSQPASGKSGAAAPGSAPPAPKLPAPPAPKPPAP